MSAKNKFGDLPPSSTVDGMRFSAAQRRICPPTGVEPVNAIFAIRVLVARACPASAPNPLTIYKDSLAIEALKKMEHNNKKPINILPVVDKNNNLLGLLRLHDLIQSGLWNS